MVSEVEPSSLQRKNEFFSILLEDFKKSLSAAEHQPMSTIFVNSAGLIFC